MFKAVRNSVISAYACMWVHCGVTYPRSHAPPIVLSLGLMPGPFSRPVLLVPSNRVPSDRVPLVLPNGVPLVLSPRMSQC